MADSSLFLGRPEQLTNPGYTPHETGGIQRKKDLGGLTLSHDTQGFQILDGQQIIGGTALMDGGKDQSDRLCFTFGNGQFFESFRLRHSFDGLGLTLCL
jgi:hypothetical protein